MTETASQLKDSIDGVSSFCDWSQDRKECCQLLCRQIPLEDMGNWELGDKISHKTGRYFSIVGLRVTPEDGPTVEQPIIHQPEIGILGFLLRREGGRLQALVQAKAEPGNVGGLQMAPTVQATVSNYMRVHLGSPTPYLEYFQQDTYPKSSDCQQSEQGTRFWGKYNRNVSVLLPVDEAPIPVSAWWRWVDVSVLLQSMDIDYLINTDSRSSLACVPWAVLSRNGEPFSQWKDHDGLGAALYRSAASPQSCEDNTVVDIVRFLEDFRSDHRFVVDEVPLHKLTGWTFSQFECCDANAEQFSVRAYHVEVKGREVPKWDQPLVNSFGLGHAVLLCQKKNGILHFLLRCSREIGFSEFAQFGPSLQTYGTTEYQAREAGTNPLFNFIQCGEGTICHGQYRQSDEGGRFHHSTVKYQLLEVHESVPIPTNASSDIWVTAHQFQALLRTKGMASNELRSAASLLLKYV